jgi:phage terminase large subunit
MPEIELPAYGWRPRSYQMGAWGALERGVKRVALEWHRRAGKDDICLHWAARCAVLEPGTYWHMLPEASQARKAIWTAVDAHKGRRRIDLAFPKELRRTTREQEMSIEFKSGSLWQVVGSDNYNSLVGSPPRGVVFSEYALADPNAWAYIRPILRENGGWALFISTTRGNNHFAKMVDFAKTDPEWYGETLTVEDTGALKAEDVEAERRELAAERGDLEATAIISQEYFCSRAAALPGAYYGQQMGNLERIGRIGAQYVWDPRLPVGTAWDLGKGQSDSMCIWFWQDQGQGPRIINYLEGSNVGLEWYTKRLHALPYTYADHLLPHDGAHPVHGSGENIETVARMLAAKGIKNRVVPRDDSLNSAINATREFLMRCEFGTRPLPMFDEKQDDANRRMERGLDCLRMYHREWSDDLRKFHDRPKHDWASHGADAFRTLARGHKPLLGKRPAGERQRYATTD